MNKINTTESPLFPQCKIYREELERLRTIEKHSNMPSYGFYFLQLLSRAVCENVDGNGEIFINGNKPQMYIKAKELASLFGVKTRKLAIKILDDLRDVYKVLDYVMVAGYMKAQKFYVFFNKIICTLPKGTYSRENKNAFYNEMAIMNNEGFFYIDKEEFFNTFYVNNKSPKGIQDFYLLLRINSVYNIDNFENVVPYSLRNCHVALWKLEYDFSKGDEQIQYSLYCRRSPLCKFLRISDKTIQRYSKILSNAKLIKTIYFHHRGNVFLFPLIDSIANEENQNFDDESNFDETTIKHKAVRRKLISRSFNNKKISEVTEQIRNIIYNFIKSVCEYTTYGRNYLFLNINKTKSIC
ncbi:MAG: hypothetical protein ACI4XC_01780 [Eubacterium sp.]